MSNHGTLRRATTEESNLLRRALLRSSEPVAGIELVDGLFRLDPEDEQAIFSDLEGLYEE